MIDETQLIEEEKWHYETSAKRVVDSLRKNHIDADYVPTKEQALARLTQTIPKGAAIGIGDSVTLHQIGLFSWLEKESQYQVFNPFLRTSDGHFVYADREERFEIMRKALVCDVFLASCNAVTLGGELVNIDGRGNRVAAMAFGPRKTILIVGVNKIVKDIEDALRRIKEICAPINAKRHIVKHHMESLTNLPCTVKGSCMKCNSRMKICRKILIVDGQMPDIFSKVEAGISVIIVGEELGI